MNNQLQPVLRYVRRLSERGALAQSSDSELLERFACRRDDEAFAVLVERYASLVFGVCRRRLHDVHDAQDASQATFLVLARRVTGIRNPEMLGSWLHGVAYRVSEQLRRDIARHRGRERPAVDVPQPDCTADISWRELRAVLDEELNRLPDRLRAPLVLCYLQGLTRDEAAQHLGWSSGTLRGRLQRGRQVLRNRLTRRGVTLPAALFAASFGGVREAGAAVLFTVRIIKATVAAEGGSAALTMISDRVVSLTEGVLKTMGMIKAKTVAAVAVAVAMLGIGTGTWTYRTLAGPPRDDSLRDPPPAAVHTPPALAKKIEEVQQAPPAGRLLAELKSNGGPAVTAVQFSPDGNHLAVGYADGTVALYDANLRQVATFSPPQAIRRGEEREVRALAFAPYGGTVTAGSSGPRGVALWEIISGRLLRQLPARGGDIASLVFSRDGKLVAIGSTNNGIRVWNVTEPMSRSIMDTGATGVRSVTFSPDGKRIAAASPDGAIQLWDVASDRIFWRFNQQMHAGDAETGSVVAKERRFDRKSRAESIAFAPDGKSLAVTAPGGEVLLLDAATGKALRSLVARRQASARVVTFAPDGKTVATASSGPGIICLWDAATGKQIAALQQPSGSADHLAFAPDGKVLASAGPDGSVRLWQVRNGQLVVHVAGVPATVSNNRLNQLVHTLITSNRPLDQQIDAIYLAVLGRYPTDTELDFTKAQLSRVSDREKGLSDIVSMLTHTREFSSNVQSLMQLAASKQR